MSGLILCSWALIHSPVTLALCPSESDSEKPSSLEASSDHDFPVSAVCTSSDSKCILWSGFFSAERDNGRFLFTHHDARSENYSKQSKPSVVF